MQTDINSQQDRHCPPYCCCQL